MILAIDPGPEKSAWLLYGDGTEHCVDGCHDELNTDLLLILGNPALKFGPHKTRWSETHLVIEWIQSYGMPVGKEVFETCFWCGRFAEAWEGSHFLMPRGDVKLYLCHSSRAKDSNVTQALRDLFGGKKESRGTKDNPGPLYIVKYDLWAALGVAVTHRAGLQKRRVL